MANIVDTFKKCCTIRLKPGAGIPIEYCEGIPGESSKEYYLPQVSIIQFDMIGVMVDYDNNVYFIPWSSIAYIQPEVKKEGNG
jgi:hypothetical protein